MGSNRHFAWQQSSGPNVRFGSKADIAARRVMSALPPKADIDRHGCDVRFVPKADMHALRANSARRSNVSYGTRELCDLPIRGAASDTHTSGRINDHP